MVSCTNQGQPRRDAGAAEPQLQRPVPAGERDRRRPFRRLETAGRLPDPKPQWRPGATQAERGVAGRPSGWARMGLAAHTYCYCRYMSAEGSASLESHGKEWSKGRGRGQGTWTGDVGRGRGLELELVAMHDNLSGYTFSMKKK